MVRYTVGSRREIPGERKPVIRDDDDDDDDDDFRFPLTYSLYLLGSFASVAANRIIALYCVLRNCQQFSCSVLSP
jgi:hypothetical protein